MKKFGIMCAGLVVAIASTTVNAQVVDTNSADGADGLAIWYDVRGPVFPAAAAPFTSGTSYQAISGKTFVIPNVRAGNLGGPGDGQTLYVSPRLPTHPTHGAGLGLHWTATPGKTVVLVNQSVKNLYKYITVEERAGGATGQVIAALGLDTTFDKAGADGVGNPIQGISLSQNTSLWSGTNDASDAAVATGDDWSITSKAVKVPVSESPVGTPVYNAVGGAVAAGTPTIYRVGTYTITAGMWRKPTTLNIIGEINNSVYTVKDKVNNLLVTRVVQTGSLTAEEPDFGYNTVFVTDVPPAGPSAGDDIATGSNGGMPEANSGGDGLTIGTTSTNADATIIVQAKGDFSNDNYVGGADNTFYNSAATRSAAGSYPAALGPLRVREVYLGDFSNDNAVGGPDNVGYNASITTLSNAANDCVPATECDDLP